MNDSSVHERRWPERLIRVWRRLIRRPGPQQTAFHSRTYETLYEKHARRHTGEEAVGAGDFDIIGRIEMAILLKEGLAGTHTLYDFGCGAGRLAVHAIPYLRSGCYYGSDIAPSMLIQADALIQRHCPAVTCRVAWIHQRDTNFPRELDRTVDMLCAFSVFTHMEHEDAYRYLTAAKRIVRPGGKFIFSCLPLHLALARTVFGNEAALDFPSRWQKVRNVATSLDFMQSLAGLAGWRVVKWYDGEKDPVPVAGHPEPLALGQSTCVLQLPD